MSFDFNDAEKQRGFDLIPTGTIVKCVGTIRPGGKSRPGKDEGDAGWLTASKSSDVMYLSWEFVVTEGPFKNRRWWQNMTISGGEVNETGESKAWNITKSTIRAMLNSARGFKPDDESTAAQAARKINSWSDLNAIEFTCKISIRKGTGNYQDQNQIAGVIEPGHKDYGGSGGAPAAPGAVSAAPPPAWSTPKPATAAAAAPVPAWAR